MTSLIARLSSLWRNLVHRTRVDRDLDEELRATLDLLTEEHIDKGLAPDAARRAARHELGNIAVLTDQVRDARAGAGLDAALHDIRYAVRLFRRTPGFTAMAIATLALGIGANAAIFGVAKSVLFDALPYQDADRLMRVHGQTLDASEGYVLLSAGMVQTIVARQQSFESIAAYDSTRDAVYGDDEAARLVRIAWVEPGLFNTLGVSAVRGRTFDAADRALGYVPASGAEIGFDTARVVIVTHEAWQRLFARDPAIIGKEIRLNGSSRTVIGVLPPGFVAPMGAPDFYLAFDLVPALASGTNWLRLVGRLKPGTTPEAAQREVAAIWASRDNPSDYRGVAMWATPLRDAMAGATRTPLLVLLASAALVLLIACANLAGALLSRGLSRQKELAVRVAIGASRQRLVRQLLTESAILSLAGGAAGLVLAELLLELLADLALPVLPAYTKISLDAGVLVATTAIALLTGLACGLVPALAISRADPHQALGGGSRGASEGRRARHVRGVLVTAQMVLCASLLAGAGVLARSLWEMSTAPLGFDTAGVFTATLRLPTREYSTLAERVRFHEQLEQRLRQLPGVELAAIANKVPTVDPRQDPFGIDGAPDAQLSVAYASVSDDYFRLLRIPLRQGRTFDASDHTIAQPTAVISERLARRFWPNGGALGARARLGGDLVTIVGIVGDVRNDLTRVEAGPMAYRSNRQESTQRLCVLLRTPDDPLALLEPVQRELAALDRSLPLQQAMTLAAAVGQGLAARRLPVTLMLAFGALALVLASVGVYAMFASLATAREREFGLRMALGSRRSAIAALMLRQGGGWMTAGLTGGALGSALIAPLLRALVVDAPSIDPLALGGAVAILVACATIAMLIPVRRATRVDPMAALRSE